MDWETLLEMDMFEYCAGEMDQGTITLVLDLVKAFGHVSLPVAWASWRDVWQIRAPSPPLLTGLERDEAGSGREVYEAVFHGRRKGREEQGHCVMQLSGRSCRNEGSANNVETQGAVCRTRTTQFGAMEKARRKTFDVRFSLSQETSRFSEELHEDWCEEGVEGGLGPCEEVERTGSGHLTNRRVEVEAADGGSCRQERLSVVVSFHGLNVLEVEEDLSTMATLLGAEGVWRRDQQKAWRRQISNFQRWKQVRSCARLGNLHPVAGVAHTAV